MLSATSMPAASASARQAMSGMLPAPGGFRLAPVREKRAPMKAVRPVGIGAKVLVSVASVAMNSFKGRAPAVRARA